MQILENLSLYYNFRFSTKNSKALCVSDTVNKDNRDLVLLDKNLIKTNIEIIDVSDMDSIIDSKNRYNLVFTNYEKISYLDYCVLWGLVNVGGFLMCGGIYKERNDKFLKKYDKSINIINMGNSFIVLEKIN